MSMKRRCKEYHDCPIGQYWHSTSELHMFSNSKGIDGLGSIEEFFAFCPYCGIDLEKKVVRFKKENECK